jgi:hypothetical protein
MKFTASAGVALVATGDLYFARASLF